MTGIEMIAAERKRQIEEEGWSAEHDAKHTDQSLAQVAAYYAIPRFREIDLAWPRSWAIKWAKKNPYGHVGGFTRLHELAIAGALIAAEIDRLLAAGLDNQ